jgi:hypothetical protein
MTPTTPSPISDQAAGDTREARLEKLMSVLDVFIAKQDEEWRYANRDLTMAFVDVVFAKDTAPTAGSAPENWTRAELLEALQQLENMLSGERGLKDVWKQRAEEWCAKASEPKYRYLTYTGQCGWLEVSKEEYDESDYRKKREPIAAPTSLAASAPDAVLVALDRMCSPLDKSWLSGVTAEEDARCMKIIRDYVLATPQVNTSVLQKIVSAWDAADASTFVKVVDEARALLAASMGGDRT